MAYAVERGADKFDGLGPKAALAKAKDLIAEQSGDVYIYDSFGDPMGLHELELAVQGVRFGDDA